MMSLEKLGFGGLLKMRVFWDSIKIVNWLWKEYWGFERFMLGPN